MRGAEYLTVVFSGKQMTLTEVALVGIHSAFEMGDRLGSGGMPAGSLRYQASGPLTLSPVNFPCRG